MDTLPIKLPLGFAFILFPILITENTLKYEMWPTLLLLCTLRRLVKILCELCGKITGCQSNPRSQTADEPLLCQMVSRNFLFLPLPLHYGIQSARQTDICWGAYRNIRTVHCIWTALLLFFEIVTIRMVFVRFRERTSFLFLFFSLFSFLSLLSTFLGVNQISAVILSLQFKHNFSIACSYS